MRQYPYFIYKDSERLKLTNAPHIKINQSRCANAHSRGNSSLLKVRIHFFEVRLRESLCFAAQFTLTETDFRFWTISWFHGTIDLWDWVLHINHHRSLSLNQFSWWWGGSQPVVNEPFVFVHTRRFQHRSKSLRKDSYLAEPWSTDDYYVNIFTHLFT